MFEFVEKNKKFVQILLGLIILTFVIGVGLQGYNAFREPYLAKVGNVTITERDLAKETSGEKLGNEQRSEMLSLLIQRQLILNKVNELHLHVSKEILDRIIGSIPAFMKEGKFSSERYQTFLSAQGKTAPQYKKELSDEIAIAQFWQPLISSSIVSQTMVKKLSGLLLEKRELNVVHFSPDALLDKVNIDTGEAKQYYEQHKNDFQLPAQARVEYIVLAQEGLVPHIQVSEEEIKAYQIKLQKDGEEERRARHILFSFPKDADSKTKAQIKNEATQILVHLKTNPEKFPTLARQYSQDPGSAKEGGDLGFFKRGVMVPSFDEAVFSLKAREISDLVETNYGFHIIQLEAIRKPKSLSTEEMIPIIKKEKAKQLFLEEQSKLNDALAMAKDLKTVAQKFRLGVQQSSWISYNTAIDPILNHDNIRNAIFSDEVLNGGYNTELIEARPGLLIAARVIEKRAARKQPFEEVQSIVVTELKKDKALKLAREIGRKALARLESGHAFHLNWSGPQLIERSMPNDHAETVRQVFKFSPKELPAYVGVDLPGGYAIYRVNKVVPLAADASQRLLEKRLTQLYGQRNANNYLRSLEKQTDIEINKGY